jgi:copper chaperone CopZ
MDRNPSDKASGVALAISGMVCGGCANTIRRVLSRVPGVTDTNVDICNGRATVVGNAPTEDLIAAVQAAGYGAQPIGSTTEGGRQ